MINDRNFLFFRDRKKDPAGYETNGHRRRRHSVVESSESYDASLFIIYLLLLHFFFFFNTVRSYFILSTAANVSHMARQKRTAEEERAKEITIEFQKKTI